MYMYLAIGNNNLQARCTKNLKLDLKVWWKLTLYSSSEVFFFVSKCLQLDVNIILNPFQIWNAKSCTTSTCYKFDLFLNTFSFHLEKPESWSAWGFDSLASIGAFCMKYNKFILCCWCVLCSLDKVLTLHQLVLLVKIFKYFILGYNNIWVCTW
jgi:uncharacterized membrane protein YkgB